MNENAIAPDTKDWTWVLERPCPECGFVAGQVDGTELGAQIRANAAGWSAALADPAAGVRPSPAVWSALEYACHVRDVHRIFGGRVTLMLAEDEPSFPNWDQDVTAVEERYGEQAPAAVTGELESAAVHVADRYDHVPADAWCRRGFRSNGSEFTIASLGRYHLHDVVHHLHDVRASGVVILA